MCMCASMPMCASLDLCMSASRSSYCACLYLHHTSSCACLCVSRWMCLCTVSWCLYVTLCLFVTSVCLCLCLSEQAPACISVCACDWLYLWASLCVWVQRVCPCHMSPFPSHMARLFRWMRKTIYFQAGGQLWAWPVVALGSWPCSASEFWF